MNEQQKWRITFLISYLNGLEECAETFCNVLFPVKGYKYKKIKWQTKCT